MEVGKVAWFALGLAVCASARALILPEAVASNFATSLPNCEPPPQNSFAQISDWAHSVDGLGQDFMRKPQPGDYVTSIGTLLDANCFTGTLAGKRAQVIAKLERVLAQTLTQAYRCEKTLGLTIAGQAIPILRRARIDCQAEHRKGVDASNEIDGGYHPFRAPFVRSNTSYDHTYKINIVGATMLEQAEETLASELFHETLHSTASKNRSWHHLPYGTSPPHNSRFCENSIYEDRIYFTESACFPSSEYGKRFYAQPSGPVDCPGVCERALTTRDPGLSDVESVKGTGSLTGIIGPSLIAPLETLQQAALTCARIRNVSAIHQLLDQEKKSIDDRFTRLANGSLLPIAGTLISDELRRQFTRLKDLAAGAYEGEADLPQRLHQLNRAKEQLRALITQQCIGITTADRDWYSFCLIRGSPVMSEADRYTALLEGLIERDQTNKKSALPPTARIQSLHRSH